LKTLYFECNMGAAGDMLMAALLELLPDKGAFIDRMNALCIPGVTVAAQPSVKCGITGTRVEVCVNGMHEESLDEPQHHHHEHRHSHVHSHGHHHGHGHDQSEHKHCQDGEHSHMGLHEIEHVISHLALSDAVRRDVLAVYSLIAEAESRVHGKPLDMIHFHEVGNADAIADIVGVCLLMELLSPERVLASPVHVGCGQVRCAHGTLPVPAPATALILQGVPCYGGAISGELCTPTGAALLKHFVSDFGDMPVLKISQIGYGMGAKDFEAANCTRAILGESDFGGDKITELCCNLDDMTPEAVAFAQEQLWEGGALDVFTTAIGMKKSRPGVMLSCMCREARREEIIALIFRHTTTLGIREYACNRHTLARSERLVETKFGAVRVKCAEGWGARREKIEFDDAAKIAREHDLTLSDVAHAVRDAEGKV